MLKTFYSEPGIIATDLTPGLANSQTTGQNKTRGLLVEQGASKSPVFLSVALLLLARDQTCPWQLGTVCVDKLDLQR